MRAFHTRYNARAPSPSLPGVLRAERRQFTGQENISSIAIA